VDPARGVDDRRLLAACAVLFGASAWATWAWCGAMAGGMRMAGGWIMSMAWMRMAGQSWPAAFALFLGMWGVMMVTMMTPSLVPMLVADRRAARARGEAHLGRRSAIVTGVYFGVWTLFGAAAWPLGVALAAAQMRWASVSRAAPVATAVLLVGVGALQFTAWKARHLGLCRTTACAAGVRPVAWRSGMALGVACVRCCLGLMLALLALGVMDVVIMAWVGAAITAERVLPRPGVVSRVTGLVSLGVGAWLLCKPS